MIITCNNCNKNFDIDSSLIPAKGRLLQCNSCDHKWFFKKEITDKSTPIVKVKDSTEITKLFKEEKESFEEENVLDVTERPKTIKLLDNVTNDISEIKKISTTDKTKKNELKKNDDELEIKISKNEKNNNNILGLIIVFIISFISIIIVLDTFQKPISYIAPNFEFLLYNLYETFNDIVLFFSDLI